MLDGVILDAQTSHLGGLVGPFRYLGGAFGRSGGPWGHPTGHMGIPMWILSIFGGFRATLGSHFELILVMFFVNWAAEMSVLVPGWFLSDLGGEVAPEPDAGMCLNHSKY